MKKRLALTCAVGCIFLLSVLSGCGDTTIPDQCLRAELFQNCLKSMPLGPTHTIANDWSEVVSECGSQAYYQSLRQSSLVKVSCR